MSAYLVHHLVRDAAALYPARTALRYHDHDLSYGEFYQEISNFAEALLALGLTRGDRVAIYAEKRFETVIAMYGTSCAGGVYVPVNPLLKADQLTYILSDCTVKTLVTTEERFAKIEPQLYGLAALEQVIVVGSGSAASTRIRTLRWQDLKSLRTQKKYTVIDSDMAAILYTSGSTGHPKGVVLSHRNIVAGARSVAEYLQLTCDDRVLSVLPLSFDYGMNQLTAMFLVGGAVVLMNYLFPRDVLHVVAKEKITGLAAVPPLWIQLSRLEWPASVNRHLRYYTNSGGHMPKETLKLLRTALPNALPYLMYGLTEAFRSTYLPPQQIDNKPDSIGKAIPNAEILVVREDGSPCDVGEPGELVHRGVLVSMGYWNDPEKTAVRFKPTPSQNTALPITELAVWSGDTVTMDEEGYFYFVSRRDEMIKTSGYRVSPTEIEEAIYGTQKVAEVAAFGVPHPVLGQAIAVVVTASENVSISAEELKSECHARLPNYMVPMHIKITHDPLPRNSNGKIDRKLLSTQHTHLFQEESR